MKQLIFFKHTTFFHQQVLFSAVLLTIEDLIVRIEFCFKTERIYMILKCQLWKQIKYQIDINFWCPYYWILVCTFLSPLTNVSSFLFMIRKGHKHVRHHGQKAGLVTLETTTKTIRCCLWLPAHITLNITGGPDQGSPPSCRPHCSPYGSLLTSKKREEII